MNNRNTGIIATVASTLLCGCPGLFLCIFGAASATGRVPFNTEVNGVSQTGSIPAVAGMVMLCLSVIFILIPVVVGVLTLRQRPAPPLPPADFNEPLPPAS
jgi:hypothetical protein